MRKQGAIWLVDFDPSVGHEYQKVRPALIVESDLYLPVSRQPDYGRANFVAASQDHTA